MIDLAVGMIIGTAFNKIVTSLVNDMICHCCFRGSKYIDFRRNKYINSKHLKLFMKIPRILKSRWIHEKETILV